MSAQGADTQSRSQPQAEGYWRRLDQLDTLLRNSDFSTSPDRWQNAHDLLLKLLEAGRLPEDPVQLRPLLAPLFCRSAREQVEFAKLFKQWLRLILPREQQIRLDESEGPQRQQVAEPPAKKLPPGILLRLFVALILILLGGYSLYLIWDPESDLDTQSRTATPGIQKTIAGDAEQKTAAPDEDLQLQPIPPRRPLERPSLDAKHRTLVGTGHWFFLLLPGLLGLAWLAVLWRGWQTVLERRRSERQQADPLHAITLADQADQLLDSSPLRGALRRLHTPVAYPTRRLHLDATVLATARHAGLLQPVFADRLAVPECLVLVDYRHDADQMAALAQLASRRLEAAGLTIHRYHYQQDPRRVQEVTNAGPGRWLSLTELVGRYPDARLLLFSAMAAYPELHWGLTRALDLNLTPDATPEDREQRLLRIARLPWCREGWLPDWLRESLLEQCGKAQRQTIANLYQQLLGQADIDGVGEISLPFDLTKPEMSPGLRSWLQRLTQLAPDESNLRDRIFANALLGNRLRSIDFLLPRNLTSHLPAGGMRLLLPRLLLVLLLSGLAGWGLEWVWQRWLQEPTITLAQTAQLAEHGNYQVKILHTGETLMLAQALSDTLSRYKFTELEMQELAADKLIDAERPGGRVNTVQLSTAQGAQTAGLVARRLAYLTWGLEPVVTNQLSEPITTEQAWQRPLKSAELRIWLLTPGRTGSPFSDRLIEPLSEEQLERWKKPPETRKPDEAAQETPQETVKSPDTQPSGKYSELDAETAIKFAPEPPSSEGKNVSSRAQVRTLQGLLDDLGFSPGPLDGILGSRTRNAIRQFQQAQGLPADGQLDDELLQQLQQAIQLKQLNQEQSARDNLLKVHEGPQKESKLGPAPSTRLQQPQIIQDKLNDGSLGPEMLVLPAGSLRMGSPEDEPLRGSNEGPQRQVQIPAFAIGRTEVTFDQYDRFAKATGRDLPNDEDWGRGRRPVINVSWQDANAYATWLSEQTGQRYRLPSEAEWEYATRAGPQTSFSTGDCIHTDQANYNGNYDYAGCGAKTGLNRGKTVPAGSLPANPWGLHEVHGNVYEWVQDCWNDSYRGAPDDGSAWEAGDCTLRVVRGGGWSGEPENLRSAIRFRNSTGGAVSDLGFRLARTL